MMGVMLLDSNPEDHKFAVFSRSGILSGPRVKSPIAWPGRDGSNDGAILM